MAQILSPCLPAKLLLHDPGELRPLPKLQQQPPTTTVTNAFPWVKLRDPYPAHNPSVQNDQLKHAHCHAEEKPF